MDELSEVLEVVESVESDDCVLRLEAELCVESVEELSVECVDLVLKLCEVVEDESLVRDVLDILLEVELELELVVSDEVELELLLELVLELLVLEDPVEEVLLIRYVE